MPEEIMINGLKFKRCNMIENIDLSKWRVKNSFTSDLINLFDDYNYKTLRLLFEKKITLKPVFIVLDNSQNMQTIINSLRLFFTEKEEIIHTTYV